MLQQCFESILAAVAEACRAHYGESLVSLAVFGSVARGTARPDSDVDLLVVARDLPRGRLARMADFHAVEGHTEASLRAAVELGVRTTLSPVFKTPAEVEFGSLLFLDMTRDARILLDDGGYLRSYLQRFETRLRALGARRVSRGGGYYWLIKPDLRPGERVEL